MSARARAGLALGGAGAAVATSSGSGSDGASGWLSSAIPDLPQRLFGALTGRSAPPPPPNPEIASSVAATQAAVAALDRSVRAQSGSRTAVVVFGAAVGGLGLAIYTCRYKCSPPGAPPASSPPPCRPWSWAAAAGTARSTGPNFRPTRCAICPARWWL